MDKPSDWKYVGEGGKHALFAYRPKDKAHARSSLIGQIIRMQKRFLAQSASGEIEQGECTSEEESTDRLHYIRDIVRPHLETYLDLPEPMYFNWDDTRSLREGALASGNIPPARVKDWTPESYPANSETSKPRGLVLADYKTIELPLDKDESKCTPPGSTSVSTEIKPKAGYLAFSPLVDPKRRSKFLKSRFFLMQDLQKKGHLEKGWSKASGEEFKMSSYEPLELFSDSGDEQQRFAQIKTQITNILECPQNNIKVWYGDDFIVGLRSKNNLTDDGDPRPFKSGVEMCADSMGFDLCGIIAAILSQESILSDILDLQKLDIIDADGAVLVYHRLVDLCDGSEEKAEEVIDAPFYRDKKESQERPPAIHHLLHCSPFDCAGDLERIKSLCEVTERFKELLESSTPLLPPEDEMDSIREEAMGIIGCLSIDECQYLLRNWMLSLAICDVSMFVTLREISASYLSEQINGAESEDGPADFGVIRRLGKQPGIVSLSPNDGDTKDGRYFLYSIKIIDCDRKPAKTLRKRDKKESSYENARPSMYLKDTTK